MFTIKDNVWNLSVSVRTTVLSTHSTAVVPSMKVSYCLLTLSI